MEARKHQRSSCVWALELGFLVCPGLPACHMGARIQLQSSRLCRSTLTCRPRVPCGRRIFGCSCLNYCCQLMWGRSSQAAQSAQPVLESLWNLDWPQSQGNSPASSFRMPGLTNTRPNSIHSFVYSGEGSLEHPCEDPFSHPTMWVLVTKLRSDFVRRTFPCWAIPLALNYHSLFCFCETWLPT